jgi:hypothetical protein
MCVCRKVTNQDVERKMTRDALVLSQTLSKECEDRKGTKTRDFLLLEKRYRIR